MYRVEQVTSDVWSPSKRNGSKFFFIMKRVKSLVFSKSSYR